MTKRSAGLLLFRLNNAGLPEVLIGHMGGPYWDKKDAHGWSIPKGEYESEEEPLAAALREFTEEVGLLAPVGEYIALGEARQPSGKVVIVWALQADLDLAGAVSNTFTLEWPPRSGQIQEFPEIDRVAWLDVPSAREALVPAQAVFLDRLVDYVAASSAG